MQVQNKQPSVDKDMDMHTKQKPSDAQVRRVHIIDK